MNAEGLAVDEVKEVLKMIESKAAGLAWGGFYREAGRLVITSGIVLFAVYVGDKVGG